VRPAAISNQARATGDEQLPEPLDDLLCPVGDDEVGAGAFEGGHLFEDAVAFIEPAALGGGFEHGVFAAHIIDGGGHAEAFFDAADEVEVGEAGFYHDDVCAFLDVAGDFAEGFGGIGGVHLVGAAVAGHGCAFGGVAKRAVEGGGEFGGVAHDDGVGEAGFVERGAHGSDAAIHHVAGRDDIGAGAGVGDGGGCEQLHARIIVNARDAVVKLGDAAVSVAHVFAEAYVGHDDERGELFFQKADGALGDAVFGVGLGGVFVLVRGDSEDEHGADAGGVGGAGFDEEFSEVELEDAGHAGDGDAAGDFFGDEKREDKVVRRDNRLAHKSAELRRGAKPAESVSEIHGRRICTGREGRRDGRLREHEPADGDGGDHRDDICGEAGEDGVAGFADGDAACMLTCQTDSCLIPHPSLSIPLDHPSPACLPPQALCVRRDG